jgi:hypothetical protein
MRLYSCLVQFVLKGHRPTHGDSVSINTQHLIGRYVCTHTIRKGCMAFNNCLLIIRIENSEIVCWQA